MFHRFNTFTVIVTLFAFAPANRGKADWFHDFDDQQLPANLVVGLSPRLPPSKTFSIDASSEYLSLRESAPVTRGGAPVLLGLDKSEMFTDVRVSATVNLDTNPDPRPRSVFGVTARTRIDAGDVQDYEFIITFVPGVRDTGTASFLRLDQPKFPGDSLELNSANDFGIPTRLDINRSYYLEFDVIGDQLTGRVFDEKGGNELLSMSYTDPMPLGPGYAGVGTTLEDNRRYVPIGGTFDDISAVSLTKSLLAGDADQDLDFDQLDLVHVQVAAKYLTGQPATWGEGDWDGAPGGSPGSPPAGDGLFNQFDIIAAQQSATYLTGPYAAVQSNGTLSDGQTSLVYNAGTGEMAVDAPAGVELTSINIDSAAGMFTGVAAQNLGGSFDNDTDANIFKATFGGSFGSVSFGNIAQPGLSEDFVLDDLAAVGSLAGGGDLGNVDLVYVPEPTSALLLAVGLVIGILQFRFENR